MPIDDTITYDYPVIDECIQMMSQKSQEIQRLTEDLESDVKRIMVEWEGTTANSYDEFSGQLSKGLEQSRVNLDSMKTTLHQASEDMQQQDKRGASNVAAS